MTPRILSLSVGWRRVASLTPGPLPLGTEPVLPTGYVPELAWIL